MSYINVGQRGATTKKALKDAVAADPSKVRFYGTGWVGPTFDGSAADLADDGTKLTVVGPDPFRNRKWYATVERKNGRVVVS